MEHKDISLSMFINGNKCDEVIIHHCIKDVYLFDSFFTDEEYNWLDRMLFLKGFEYKITNSCYVIIPTEDKLDIFIKLLNENDKYVKYIKV